MKLQKCKGKHTKIPSTTRALCKIIVVFLCNKLLLISSELYKTIGVEWQCCHLYILPQFNNGKLFLSAKSFLTMLMIHYKAVSGL